jgi:zeaxanthin glucosyltransferase
MTGSLDPVAPVLLLVLDNNHRFIELVPMSLNIPYVQIWNILHIDGSGSTPPAFVSWLYEDNPKARTGNIEVLKKTHKTYLTIDSRFSTY